MQVFKLYFKILRKYLGTMLMYVGIFIGVTLGIIVPQTAKNQERDYTKERCNFAVFDNDGSTLSKAAIVYLKENHNFKTIKNSDRETIQDALYAMDVHSVIVFNEGFEKSFLEGKTEESLDVYVIPNTVTTILFEQHLDSYFSVVNTYVSAGMTVDEAVEKAVEVTKASVELVATEEKTVTESPISIYFKYSSWVFIAMCVSGITVVLIALNKKEVRNRIECSSYKFVKMNMETLLAVLFTGIAVCGIFVVAAFAVFGGDMLKKETVFYTLNAMAIMLVALAITFFISKVTDKVQVISLLSNVIGLGMAFLCGVFVPMEFLSDGIIKIAHFLPVYWNVRALRVIGGLVEGSNEQIFSYMGIQVLFAVAIVCVAMIIDRNKRVAK